MTLWKRIMLEKRALIVPLAFGIIANIAAYALVLYPLRMKSAGAAERATAAAAALGAAEREHDAARALVSGKVRAEQELLTFYGKVLPADEASAVRLVYVPLSTLAKKANVRILARRFSPDQPKKDDKLIRFHIVASMQGEYEGLRQFIYELESWPQFVIIDDLTMAQGEQGKPLTFSLRLSTYYPLSAHGN